MLSQSLSASTDMYKENARILSLLDDKAQKAAGLAGVYLAAALAFLRQDSLNMLKAVEGKTGIVLLAVALALLVICVLIGGLVMWSRKLKLPPNPNVIYEVCDVLLSRPGSPTDAERESHLRDQIKGWNLALHAQDGIIAKKSRLLLSMQWVLIAAMAVVATLLGLVGFCYIL
jgi:hypothetical protein